MINRKNIAKVVLGSMLFFGGYSSSDTITGLRLSVMNPEPDHLTVRYHKGHPRLYNLTTGQVLEITTDPETVVGSIEYRVNTLERESASPELSRSQQELLLRLSQKLEYNVYSNKFKGKQAAEGFTDDFLEIRKKVVSTPEGVKTFLTDGSNCQPITDMFQLGNQKYRFLGLYEENKEVVKKLGASLAEKVVKWYSGLTEGW